MRTTAHLRNINRITPSLMRPRDIRYNADPFAVSQYEFPSSRIRTFQQFLSPTPVSQPGLPRGCVSPFSGIPIAFPLARPI